jgi:RIO kinase 1
MSAARSNRPRSRRYDDADWRPEQLDQPELLERSTARYPSRTGDTALDDSFDAESPEPRWSTYRDAAKGPQPVPAWVVTNPLAIDHDLGEMKSGKEADVSLLRRQLTDGDQSSSSTMAVKRYRGAEHRLFHRDAGYLEGRRVRRSRENRAMATRTSFGKELIAQQWASAEFAILGRLWQAGAAVPYPVQLIGTELMMEFIGSPDGVAAPRLAQVRADRALAVDLYRQLVDTLHLLADSGYAHGDLSAYNVLVHEGRLVIIDLPQAVDVIGNPQGFDYLRRDCQNICGWFAASGVSHARPDDLFGQLAARLRRLQP